MKNIKFKKGFSLVELLVVITIIAILSVVAYSAVGGQTIKAKDSKRKQDLNTMQSALEIYYVEYSKYPSSLTYCTTTPPSLTTTPETHGCILKKHLSTIPKDPSGQGYVYKTSSGNATYQIAATLENDGTPEKYKAYVVGNGTDLISSNNSYFQYSNSSWSSCGGPIENDKICIPYKPIAPSS